ncbi:PAS domain S-box protein, partial [Candidatus Bathyarchaeota archaeon]|nr:PAS domain S-box protein [Candidatus Bathyarchaeota archaeon]
IQPVFNQPNNNSGKVTKENPIRVLQVDDEALLLKVSKQILEMQGPFQVESAASVEEAHAKMRENKFDVIVSDYQMPEKDGLEFLKELRNNGNNIPFILFTGKGREEVIIEALNIGADYYINKLGKPETVYGELAHTISRVVTQSRVESALVLERERLETVTKHMSAGLAIISKDFRILWANNVLKKVFGDDYEGKICYALINQRKSACMGCGVKEIFEKGTDQVVHEQLVKGVDGQDVWLEIIATPIKDTKGDITSSLELVNDITERKKMEQELQKSEEKYRKQFEEALDAIFLADTETGILVDCNRAATELVGRKKSELIGNHQQILHPPEEIEGEFNRTFKQHLKEKEGQVLETHVITKNGEIRDVAIKANVFEVGNKKIMQGTFRDITERKKTENALRESAEKYRDLINAMNDKVWVIDFDGKFIDVNDAAVKVLGYSREELLSMGPTDIDDALPAEEIKALVKGMKTDEIQVFETAHTTKDGKKIPVEISSSRVNHQGKPAILSISRNITRRKLLEKALQENEE